MEKTLKHIQTLAKVGKVLSTIVFIFSIIGGVGCLLGLISFGAVSGLVIDGKSILEIASEQSGQYISKTSVYFSLVTSIFVCAGEAVMAKFAQVYFKHELDAKTPLKVELAKEMLRLGVICIAISVGVAILCAIVEGVFTAASGNEVELNYNNSSSFGIGIAFLIVGTICKYASLREEAIISQFEKKEISEKEESDAQ